MRRTLVALPLALVAVITLHSTPAGAQDKMARGTVTAMAGDSITIKAADGDMKFTVDPSTKVIARGAGTRAGRAAAAGQSGPTLSEVVKIGQAVEVTYTGSGGAMKASEIRAVASASGGTAGAAGGAKMQTVSGTVSSVSLTSITIGGGAGGGAKFTRTFAVDTTTTVVGRGAGTAAASAGGRTVITDLVANGDRVTISYSAMGGMNHASEIRVTGKPAAMKK